MTNMKQPEALRLAEILEDLANHGSDSGKQNAAAELRRLHKANQAMLEALKGLCGDRVYDYHIREAQSAIASAEGMNKGEQQ